VIVLIDGDVLRYELGAVAIEKDECFGVPTERPWPDADVNALVDQRIQSIIERCGANEYRVYLTGAGNFRFEVATLKPYKGNRAAIQKPYHWRTVSDRLVQQWGARIVEGVEADDALALAAIEAARAGTPAVIASRDKDLRQVPGFHYSWACGEDQPEIPVYSVVGSGEISVRTSVYPSGTSYKLLGNGLKFFYGQLLVGDTVDNIGGCPKVGPVKAFETLNGLETEQEMFQACAFQYHRVYGDKWREALIENARLLWLIQDPEWVSVEEADGVFRYTINKMWESEYDLVLYDD
jgi:hypothetical protein